MQKYLRGQVWWCRCSYDVNSNERDLPEDRQKLFDHVQRGMRPVLIISNDDGNKYSNTLQVVPCTTNESRNYPTHCTLYINKTKNVFLCEQIKVVNAEDLRNYLVTLDSKEMERIEECIKIALGIESRTEYTNIDIGGNVNE